MTKQKKIQINWLFVFVVIIPTVISSFYFSSMASDIYTSESRFVIRSPQQQTAKAGLSALLKGGGFSRSQEDSYAVQDFMLSRDALQQLDEKFKLRKMFSSNDIDLVNRFGGLDWDTSFEALQRYYQKHVGVGLDSASSITTLVVKTYSPDSAYKINEELLAMTEKLINKLNERGRSDILEEARSDLDKAEKNAKEVRLAIAEYRNKTTVVDPTQQSLIQLQQVSKLQDALITTKTQLAQLKELAPQNPQIKALQKRISELKKEISTASAKITGGKRSLASKTTKYEQLVLEREFANEQLAAAVVSYKQARDEIRRKQLYLERIVQPNKPDASLEPRRLRSVIATLILSLVVWGILSMLFAGVREHHS